MKLAFEVKFYGATFSELHVHGDERWRMEVSSISYSRGVDIYVFVESFF